MSWKDLDYPLKVGIIYSFIVLINILIRLTGNSFSFYYLILLAFSFFIGVVAGKILKRSEDWPCWLRFGSLFAIYSVLINIIGLMWEGSLELFLIISAPTFILFIFSLMGTYTPSIQDIIKVHLIIIITSGILWFLVGSIFGTIRGAIKGEKKNIPMWLFILILVILSLLSIGVLIFLREIF